MVPAPVRAQPATGSSTTIAKFRSTDSGPRRGRRASIQRHEIATAHLTLDLEAQPFKEAFYRQIKTGLQCALLTWSRSVRLDDLRVRPASAFWV